MLYTYVLLSEKDKKFYIGSMEDLRARLEKHNSGKVKSTASRRPFSFGWCLAIPGGWRAGSDKSYFKFNRQRGGTANQLFESDWIKGWTLVEFRSKITLTHDSYSATINP